jgi:tetratricopeptide (TPR) repeat protein
MKDSLEYIDSYFKGKISGEELQLFEERIIRDPVFAQELAFYIGSVQTIKNQLAEDKKSHFRKLYEESKQARVHSGGVTRMWPYMTAAAAICGIVLALFVFYPSPTPASIADTYIYNNLSTLGVRMGASDNEVQEAIQLYNEQKLDAALQKFEQIIQSHPSDHKLKEYAGIVSLRLGEYDKALEYFRQLERQNGLYANPGKFYIALTLLKRNRPGDAEQSRKLLQEVEDKHLEYESAAKELLKKL